MIDVNNEKLLTFSAFAASLPNTPNVSTIHRWRLRGCRGVRLESVMLGGCRYTSAQAGQRFFDRITAVADGKPAPEIRTPSQREKAINRAEAELSAAGI